MPVQFRGDSGDVPGYDGAYLAEGADTLYRKANDGTLTAVSTSVTLTDGSVALRNLTRAAQQKMWLPSDVLSESFPLQTANNVTLSTTTLRTRLSGGLVIPAGRTCTAIEFWSGTTAAAGVSHMLMGLYDLTFNLIATSADAGATTWAASTAKRLSVTTPYVASVDTAVYAGLLIEATTMPTLVGSASVSSAVNMTGLGPPFGGVNVAIASPATAMENPSPSLSSGSAVAYVRLIGT